MIYGIVGNRNGWKKDDVFILLKSFKITSEDIIISGGAEGVDTLAQDYAKYIGCEMIIVYPNPKEPSPERYFNRNLEIAKRCNILIAFDKGSSSGSGTQNTINHAERLLKDVIIINK